MRYNRDPQLLCNSQVRSLFADAPHRCTRHAARPWYGTFREQHSCYCVAERRWTADLVEFPNTLFCVINKRWKCTCAYKWNECPASWAACPAEHVGCSWTKPYMLQLPSECLVTSIIRQYQLVKTRFVLCEAQNKFLIVISRNRLDAGAIPGRSIEVCIGQVAVGHFFLWVLGFPGSSV